MLRGEGFLMSSCDGGLQINLQEVIRNLGESNRGTNLQFSNYRTN